MARKGKTSKVYGPLTKQEADKRQKQSTMDKAKAMAQKNVPVYQVQKKQTRRVPRIQQSPSGDSCTVTHREFLTDVIPVGSAWQILSTYNINPGQTFFNWLSKTANQFEEYKFKYLIFEYVPMTSTTTAGEVMYGFDKDASDNVPQNKQTLMNYAGANSGPVYMPFNIKVDTRDIYKKTLQGLAPSITSVLDFYLGILYVASQGYTGSSPVGGLWVRYSVQLRCPQVPLYQPPSFSLQSTSGVSNAVYQPTVSSNIPYSTSTNQITIAQPGTYLLEMLTGCTSQSFLSVNIVDYLTNASCILNQWNSLTPSTSGGNFIQAFVFTVAAKSLIQLGNVVNGVTTKFRIAPYSYN